MGKFGGGKLLRRQIYSYVQLIIREKACNWPWQMELQVIFLALV